ncbi:MAG: sensor histidine kinase [Roseivivax sp.]|nr:sensor histidine kinase [Roseivivax sp.]
MIILAVWLDPAQPTRLHSTTYVVLQLYALFAASGAALLLRHSPRPVLALAAHLTDLGVFTFLVFTTDGPTSPFFLLYTFSIISAAFRWRWRGALWTSIAVLMLLVVSAFVFYRFVPGSIFETDRFLVRCAHVGATGGLLVYFAYHQDRIAEETRRFRPPKTGPWYETERTDFLAKCAAHVAQTFHASGVVIAMDDSEEPSAGAYIWQNGNLAVERIDPAVFGRMTATVASSPVWTGSQAEWRDMTRLDDGPAESPDKGKLAEFGADLAGHRTLLSVPVPGEYARGRMFIAKPGGHGWDAAIMAEILGRQIGEGLDQIEVSSIQNRAIDVEARLSLARDLHDGILQTLAGTALQLENLARDVEARPETVRARIAMLQDWLVGEQREVRKLIRRLRPGQAEGSDTAYDGQAGTGELARRLCDQWGIAVVAEEPPIDLEALPDIRHHLFQIIREATANAVRHGDATRVHVSFDDSPNGLRLRIADNGRGLAQHGTFDQAEAASRNIGPRSLRERVTGIGGTLSISSSELGTELDILLPVPGKGRTG